MIEKTGTIGRFTVYKDSSDCPVHTGYKGLWSELVIDQGLKYRNYFKLYLPKRLRKRAMKGKL